jgi:hypothetical protein
MLNPLKPNRPLGSCSSPSRRLALGGSSMQVEICSKTYILDNDTQAKICIQI